MSPALTGANPHRAERAGEGASDTGLGAELLIWTGLSALCTWPVLMALGQAIGAESTGGGAAAEMHRAMWLAGFLWASLGAAWFYRALPELPGHVRVAASAVLGAACTAVGVLINAGLFFVYLLVACSGGGECL